MSIIRRKKNEKKDEKIEDKFIKVRLEDLQNNPFRGNLESDKKDIEELCKSVGNHKFWDNILVNRKTLNGKTEFFLCYGHTRRDALIQVYGKDKEIFCAFRDNLSDIQMLKILAEENSVSYNAKPIKFNEMIEQTQKFLVENPKILESLVDPSKKSRVLNRAINEGKVGVNILSRFIGNGYTRSSIAESLRQWECIDNNIILREDLEKCKTQSESKKVIDDKKNKTPEEETGEPEVKILEKEKCKKVLKKTLKILNEICLSDGDIKSEFLEDDEFVTLMKIFMFTSDVFLTKKGISLEDVQNEIPELMEKERKEQEEREEKKRQRKLKKQDRKGKAKNSNV